MEFHNNCGVGDLWGFMMPASPDPTSDQSPDPTSDQWNQLFRPASHCCGRACCLANVTGDPGITICKARAPDPDSKCYSMLRRSKQAAHLKLQGWQQLHVPGPRLHPHACLQKRRLWLLMARLGPTRLCCCWWQVLLHVARWASV